jgi:hypothetical protein
MEDGNQSGNTRYGLAKLVLAPGGHFLETTQSKAEELVAAKAFVVEVLSS